MNAIINLNHFCEVHGPQTIFTTQTIRDKSYIQSSSSNESSSQNIINCESCSSIGNKMFFVSEDNSIMFVSSEKSLFGKEHQNALKQAALRSLCEISSNKEENLVFFGDSRINSLCYSFKIKDSYARGFEKLYSIVILMKDKMFLLNSQPFLAHNIKEIAKQIQESALKVYETEQKQFSQRAERLNTGKLCDLPSRSLKDLVGEQHIFAQLHSLFSWILWAGARYFTEVLTLGSPSMPSFCKDSPDGFAFISIDKEEFMMQNFPSGLGDSTIYDGEYNLRNLKQVSKLSFNQLLYCCLVGTQIVIRGKNNDFYKYFKELMPQAFHHLIAESPKYLTVQKCRILTLPSTDIFIPQNNVCRIDFMDELDVPTFIKYPIELPSKLPTLMTKILYAVDEKLFTNHTMYKYIQAIVEEWKNKIICLSHHHHHHDDTAKLKKVLEIQSHDEELVKYWLSVL